MVGEAVKTCISQHVVGRVSTRPTHNESKWSQLQTVFSVDLKAKMSKEKRGKLIVFEGLDRAGKTTQCAKLVESLRAQGRNVKALRFPGIHLLLIVYVPQLMT